MKCSGRLSLELIQCTNNHSAPLNLYITCWIRYFVSHRRFRSRPAPRRRITRSSSPHATPVLSVTDPDLAHFSSVCRTPSPPSHPLLRSPSIQLPKFSSVTFSDTAPRISYLLSPRDLSSVLFPSPPRTPPRFPTPHPYTAPRRALMSVSPLGAWSVPANAPPGRIPPPATPPTRLANDTQLPELLYLMLRDLFSSSGGPPHLPRSLVFGCSNNSDRRLPLLSARHPRPLQGIPHPPHYTVPKSVPAAFFTLERSHSSYLRTHSPVILNPSHPHVLFPPFPLPLLFSPFDSSHSLPPCFSLYVWGSTLTTLDGHSIRPCASRSHPVHILSRFHVNSPGPFISLTPHRPLYNCVQNSFPGAPRPVLPTESPPLPELIHLYGTLHTSLPPHRPLLPPESILLCSSSLAPLTSPL
ncbi:unnamed protein product [Dicrocoelium dendriticum]|nr:unnamed protein product [Dicrocoelium dendriticum]